MSKGVKCELGNELCNKELSNGKLPDFSASWFYNPQKNEWSISLRGNENISPDLSIIASYFDGGGHKYSSAFVIKQKNLMDVFTLN